MSALGKLVVSLSLESAAFTKGLDKGSQEALRFAKNSQDSFDKFERSAKDSFGNAVKSAASLGAAFIGVSSALSSLSNSINNLAALDDLSQKTGSSVEQLSRLQKVATQFEQDFGQVEGALTKLAKNMGDLSDEGGKTSAALKVLGVNSKDLSGNLRDPADVMIDVAKALQNYSDGAGKAAIANDLFGKSGVELLPFLNDVNENIDRFKGVSAQAAANASIFNDQLGSLKVGFSELVDSVSIGILPQLNSFIGKLNEIARFKSLFSSVGGIESKDYAKEIARRENDLKDIIKTRDALSKPTRANKINEFIFNDVRDLNRQITIYQDEITALKIRQDAETKKASPYVNPTGKPALNYDSEAAKKAKEEAEKAAKKAQEEAEKRAKDARDKAKSRAEEAAKAAKDEALRVSQATAKNMADEMDNYKKRAEERKKLSDKAAEEEKDRIEKVMQYQQDLANKNFDEAQRQAKEIADIQQRENEQTGRELSQALTNGLFDSFKKGESFGTAMVRNIVAFGQTWFARMFEGLLSGGFASLASIFSGNANAGEGGASVIDKFSNSFSDLGKIFQSGNDSLVRGIEGLGTFLSTGNGGLGDTLGGLIGQYSSQISNVLPFAGAAFSLLKGDTKGAIGSALGAALTFTPLGAAGGIVGSLIGGALGGVFGGGHVSRPKFYNNSTVSSAGVKSFNSYGNSDASGKNVAKSAGGAIGAQIAAYADAFGGSLKDFTLGTTFSQKYNTYGISIGNKIAKDGKNRDVAFNPKTAGLQEKAIAQSFLIAMKKGFVNLPDYLVDIVKKSSLKRDDALTNIQTLSGIKSLKDSLAGLPPVFDALNYSISQVTLSTAGGLQGQFAGVAKFVELFYSADEQFKTFTKQLTAQTAALGVALPTSRDAYRALVDGIKVTDTSTSNLFNGLVGLAPAMDAYFNQLQDQKGAIEGVNQALADSLQNDLFSTYADYRSAQANVAIGNSAAPFMANSAQGDSALAKEVKELRDQGANQQTVLETIAAYLYNMEKIYKQWNGDGLPETRVI